jgi:hypothetical protein
MLNNTFLWLPDLSQKTISNTLEIAVPSAIGTYILLFQSINNSGEKTFFEEKFTVE